MINEESFFNSQEKASIIIGSDFSGKTSLLRWLLTKYSENNPIVLLDGGYIYKTKDFRECVQKAFEDEFTGDFKKWYGNENKILLVDNYHHGISENFLGFARDNFAKVL